MSRSTRQRQYIVCPRALAENLALPCKDFRSCRPDGGYAPDGAPPAFEAGLADYVGASQVHQFLGGPGSGPPRLSIRGTRHRISQSIWSPAVADCSASRLPLALNTIRASAAADRADREWLASARPVAIRARGRMHAGVSGAPACSGRRAGTGPWPDPSSLTPGCR